MSPIETDISQDQITRISVMAPNVQDGTPLGNIASALPTESRPFGLLITNNSDQAVTGLLIQTTGLNKGSVIHRYQLKTDSYSTPELRPVLRPHDRLLIYPGGFMLAESMAQNFWSGSAVVPSANRLVAVASRFEESTSVKIAVDAVIYADGLIEGTNSFQIDKQIQDRWSASSLIIKTLDKARTENQPDNVTFTALASSTNDQPDGVERQRIMIAKHLLQNEYASSYISYLKTLSPPPTFFTTSSEGRAK